MATTKPADQLTPLLEKLRKTLSPPHESTAVPEHTDAALHELVRSFLLWEAPRRSAASALARIAEHIADYNDLRVCFADDVERLLGPRYPRVWERCRRLRATLNEIFDREHALTLSHLADIGKREARVYLDSLEHAPVFVQRRVHLLALGGHAFPVDERLAAVLRGYGVVEEGETPDALSSRLERLVRAGEAAEAYGLVEAAADGKGPPRAPRTAATRKASPRKTARKKASKDRGGG